MVCRQPSRPQRPGRAQQPHYVSETQRILLRVARHPDCRVIPTRHALLSLKDDNRTMLDVEHALTNGRVIWEEHKQDVLWRVEGRDLDGGKIRVVVAVYEREIIIKVVTTF